MADTRSRKWQITINNPVDKGFTHERIVELLGCMKSVVYYCLSDEIGTEGTYHTHVFFYASNAVRFSSVQKAFQGGHFEMARGTCQENRDYVFKEGKWSNTDKEGTNLPDTHVEFGECPVERSGQGRRNDLADLYDMINSGLSNVEILESNPEYLFNIDKIDRARMTLESEKYRVCKRDLTVTYIYGVTGAGKTSSVVDSFGYSNIYRVTNYVNPFDTYSGEDVIVFEEFRSSLPFSEFLSYIDVHPVKLRARYFDRQAMYTKVFIISNQRLECQYQNVAIEHPEDWDAFARRIHFVEKFSETGVVRMPCDAYLYGWRPCIINPF